jgi:hypothetical protein
MNILEVMRMKHRRVLVVERRVHMRQRKLTVVSMAVSADYRIHFQI